ncbi:MAG: DUF1759 domain-containing protein, partial [Cyanobacteria bacterium J06614_10]
RLGEFERELLNKLQESRNRKESPHYNMYNQILSLQSRVADKIHEKRPSADSRASIQAEAVPPDLGPLEPPSFGGDVEQFPQFWELFNTLIDQRPELGDIEKFAYLLKYLKGEAREALSSILIKAENYQIALKTLVEQYGAEDKRILLLQTKLRKLPIPTFDYPSLYNFRHDLLIIHRQLETISEGQTDSIVIMGEIVQKLQEGGIYLRVVEKLNKVHFSYQELDELLQLYVTALSRVQPPSDNPLNLKPSNDNTFEKGLQGQDYPPTSCCRVCSGAHDSGLCTNLSVSPQITTSRRRETAETPPVRPFYGVSSLQQPDMAVGLGQYPKQPHSYNNHSRKGRRYRPKFQDQTSYFQDNLETVEINTLPSAILPTITLNLNNGYTSLAVHTFLECGSQRSFISQRLARRLGLRACKLIRTRLITFGGHV